jgi:hypothetical protein
MKTAHEYLEHAKECRALARTAVTDNERQQLVQMATTWETLAKQRVNFVDSDPELSRGSIKSGV